MVSRVKLAVVSWQPRKAQVKSGQSTSVGTAKTRLTGLPLLLLVLCGALPQKMVSALSCEPCDQFSCTNDTACPGSLVPGPCGCCYECARQVNQSCGGHYNLKGTCDKNLHCVIPESNGHEDESEGICLEISEVECVGLNCPPAYQERRCPPDSFMKNREMKVEENGDIDSGHQDDVIENEATSPSVSNAAHGKDAWSFCQCNMSLCHVPTCATGFTLRLLQNGTGVPGTCCDVHECYMPSDCSFSMCPPVEEEPCPKDSVRLTPMWTDDHCCQVQQGCACPAEDTCDVVECPAGHAVKIMSEATGLPGSCCTSFTCVAEPSTYCTFNGQKMRHGQIWQADQCRTCECKHGVSKCFRKVCPETSCSFMAYPEGDCCPVCRGCVSESGQVHNESETWQENDCTSCTCRHGKTECQSEMCSTECLNPKRVPGQCCPVCKETCHLFCPFGFSQDHEGNTLCHCAEDKCATYNREHTCDKVCQYGFKTTRDGCVKCKCKKCPQLNCTKRCAHGLVSNDEGCPLCKCKDSYDPDLIDSDHKQSDGKTCMSTQGLRHVNGESWHDGCRVCYCHNGIEMCSLLVCPALLCSSPVFKLGDCCPSCPGLPVAQLDGEKERCQTDDGHYYVEGQTWHMDTCTLCVCHTGNILCQTPTCPPVVCHHPVKLEGQCCATCKDDVSKLPMTSHRHCRSFTNLMHKHGEVWRSSPCQSCTCLDGQILCYSQVCPPLNCDRAVLRKGHCCPTCSDTPKVKVCLHNKVKYESGEKWLEDNCTQCLCVDGLKECFPLTCPALDCPYVMRQIDQCCYQCYEPQSYESQNNRTNEVHDQNAKSSADTGEKTFLVFGFSMLVVALLAIVVVIFLVRTLIRKSRHYQSKPADCVENQKTLINSTNEAYWKKFTAGPALEVNKGNKNCNDYTEMVFTETSKGGYKSAIIS